MLPGPTLIKKCSACGGLIEEETLISGNTCGAVFWTDGEFYAPMMPDQPELVKCPHCKALLWIEELEVVGDDGRNRYDDFVPVVIAGLDSQTARPYTMPSIWDYFRLLKNELPGLDRECYLRLRAWRAGNRKRRGSEYLPGMFRIKNGDPLAPLSRAEIDNMDTLSGLLDEDDDEDRLLKAELLRELGYFEKCLGLLAKPFKEEFRNAAAFIKGLAYDRDTWVREIKELDFR